MPVPVRPTSQPPLVGSAGPKPTDTRTLTRSVYFCTAHGARMCLRNKSNIVTSSKSQYARKEETFFIYKGNREL
jgi:hypothetical protein